MRKPVLSLIVSLLTLAVLGVGLWWYSTTQTNDLVIIVDNQTTALAAIKLDEARYKQDISRMYSVNDRQTLRRHTNKDYKAIIYSFIDNKVELRNKMSVTLPNQGEVKYTYEKKEDIDVLRYKIALPSEFLNRPQAELEQLMYWTMMYPLVFEFNLNPSTQQELFKQLYADILTKSDGSAVKITTKS